MRKIGIIGRTAEGKKLFDGQTVLTKMFRNQLIEQLNGVKVICVDTYEYKKHVIKCFFKTLYCLFISNEIFILLSYNGLSFYLPFLYYTNKIFNRKIYHRVIGGNLDILVDKHPKWIKYLNALEFNYVELQSLSDRLNKKGIKNVKVSPNFKSIEILKKEDLKKYNRKDEIRFCTFSRVTKEKGISDAIDAIVKYNKKTNNKVYLDIYGPIDETYKEEFDKKLKKSKYVFYKGVISASESVTVLKNYYMLLFPTYWEGEGFPGTLIDAFSSGLPTIATNWNYNSEIIDDGITGIIYDYTKPNLLIDKIIYAVNNPKKINQMRFNCIKEAEKYKPEIVVVEIIKDIQNKKKKRL